MKMKPFQSELAIRRSAHLLLVTCLVSLTLGLISPSNGSPATTQSSSTGSLSSSARMHHKHAHHGHSHQEWDRTEIMDANGLYILEWNVVDAKEIVFKITANTRGFIGLGFSYKSGKMANADLVLAWVDDHTGKANVLVNGLPLIILLLLSSLSMG